MSAPLSPLASGLDGGAEVCLGRLQLDRGERILQVEPLPYGVPRGLVARRRRRPGAPQGDQRDGRRLLVGEGDALAAQQVADGLGLEGEVVGGDVVGGGVALRAHPDGLHQLGCPDVRQVLGARKGRHGDQPLQQRAERGLLAVGQGLLLGLDGILGAGFHRIVGNGVDLLGRARRRRPKAAPKPPGPRKCSPLARGRAIDQQRPHRRLPAIVPRLSVAVIGSDPTDSRTGLLCPHSWIALGRKFEVPGLPRPQRSPVAWRNLQQNRRAASPTATRASTSTPATRWSAAIKPLAKATRRPGRGCRSRRLRRAVRPEAGGLQGPDPGRRQRRRRHQAQDRHRDRPARHASASIWSPCASTTCSCRAPSRCSSSTISPPASWTWRWPRAVVAGIAEGCRQAGCALIGGETAEMPGMYAGRRLRPRRLLPSARWSAAQVLPRSDIAAGDVLIGLPSSGVHSNGYSLVRRLVADARLAWDAPAPFDATRTLAEALLEPTRIYVKPVLRADPRHRRRQGAGAHHRRRPVGERAARAARRHCRAHRSRRLAGSRGVRLAHAGRQPRRRARCCAPSTAASAWWLWSRARAPMRSCARSPPPARRPIRIGEIEAGRGVKSQAKGKGEAEAVRYSGELRFAS